MPYIFFYGPEFDREKKRALVDSLAESASKATEMNKAHFTVILRHLSPDDVGVGGELVSDKMQKRNK